MRNLQEQVKKAFCLLPKFFLTFHCLKKIVLVILKILQILGLQPQISKVFSRSLELFFLTVGQNNFGNKIPFFFFCVAFLELWPWKDKKRPLLLRYFVMALSQNWPLSRNFFCTNTNTETFNALFSKTHKVKYKCTLVMKIQI